MTNAVATQQQASAPAAQRQPMGMVPQTMEEGFRFADAVSQSGMAPNGLDSPQKVMVAMVAGMELGMSPMQSIQSVAVINGRPCIWGDGLLAPVRSHPKCEYIKEWIEGEGDGRVAICETQRTGEPAPVQRRFSVDDAKRAGKWTEEAMVTRKARGGGTYEKENDSPWYRYPERMLQMRARSWCLRDVYADVLKGVQVREEVEDIPARDQPKDVTPPSGPTTAEKLAAAQEEQAQEPVQHTEGFGTGEMLSASPSDVVDHVEPVEEQQATSPSEQEATAPSGDDEKPSKKAEEPKHYAPKGDDLDLLTDFIAQYVAAADDEARAGVTDAFMERINAGSEDLQNLANAIKVSVNSGKPAEAAALLGMTEQDLKDLA